MRWKRWLENWDMTSLKINAHFLELEWKPQDEDKDAAWELYIELLTRITTQPLPPEAGVEKTALDSVYKLFELTREIIIKRHSRVCAEFTKLAIVVLNQIVRPFHRPLSQPFRTRSFRRPRPMPNLTPGTHRRACDLCVRRVQ